MLLNVSHQLARRQFLEASTLALLAGATRPGNLLAAEGEAS